MGEEDSYKFKEAKKMSSWTINLKYSRSLKSNFKILKQDVMDSMWVKNQIPDMMERLKNLKVGDERIGDMGVSMQNIE